MFKVSLEGTFVRTGDVIFVHFFHNLLHVFITIFIVFKNFLLKVLICLFVFCSFLIYVILNLNIFSVLYLYIYSIIYLLIYLFICLFLTSISLFENLIVLFILCRLCKYTWSRWWKCCMVRASLWETGRWGEEHCTSVRYL